MFFKGVAIFHPLHPGATPWYFASLYYIASTVMVNSIFNFECFFKGDAISHPLNPGAMPWYFASALLYRLIKTSIFMAALTVVD